MLFLAAADDAAAYDDTFCILKCAKELEERAFWERVGVIDCAADSSVGSKDDGCSFDGEICAAQQDPRGGCFGMMGRWWAAIECALVGGMRRRVASRRGRGDDIREGGGDQPRC